MLEVLCHGADFAAYGAQPLSPIAEVELDGFIVGRTRTHVRGDSRPRWNDPMPVMSTGHQLVFRVRDSDRLLGEAVVDLQQLLRGGGGPGVPRMAPLTLHGRKVGTLQFSYKQKQPARTGSAGTIFYSVTTPHGATPAHAQDRGGTGAGGYAFQPVPANPRAAAAAAQPGYTAGMPATHRNAGVVACCCGKKNPVTPVGRSSAATGAVVSPAAALPESQPLRAPRSSAPREAARLPITAGEANATAVSAGAHGSSASLTSSQGLGRPSRSPKNGSSISPTQSLSPKSPTNGKRLDITERGGGTIAELMQSKDRLRAYAELPFKGRPQGARLNFQEFSEGLKKILKGLTISIPDQAKMAALFDKARRSSEGVGVDEFEALLFRLLCFLRASRELEVAPPQGHRGEQRDQLWRQEFIKRNTQRFADVYDIEKQLGKGSFGTVHLVHHKTQRGRKNEKRVRVCKIIQKTRAKKAGTTEAKVREELAVLKQLDHPHVLRIFEDFEDDENFYLVMEPCRGGDLQEFVADLEPMDAETYEFWVAKVMHQTLSALSYCHSKGVIHKDLKPENVMLSTERGTPVQDIHVVVVDFGLAEMFDNPEDRSTVISGTPPYMAPEVWKGNFSKSCDIWSAGVMMFFLLAGRLPFVAQKIEEFPKAVGKDPPWELMGGASKEAHEFCNLMLKKREDFRPTAQMCLRNRWFQQRRVANTTHGGIRALGKNQINSIMSVAQRSPLEKFVERVVATQIDASKEQSVNEAFRALDQDGDGLLSMEELRSGLASFAHSPEHLEEVVNELDVGRTGQVSYTAFLAGVVGLRGRRPQEQDKLLWIAWQQFCPDEKGRVRIDSIHEALANRGMTVADLPDSFLAAMSEGKSEFITFEAFKSLLLRDGAANKLSLKLSGHCERGGKLMRWIMGKMSR